MLGRLSPPLPMTSIGHNQMTTMVLIHRICCYFGCIVFDIRGCVNFIHGSRGGKDSVAEDYSVEARRRGFIGIFVGCYLFGGTLLQLWGTEGICVRSFSNVKAVVNYSDLELH